jgi:hypothetical protein
VIEQVSFWLTRTSCDVRFRAAAKGIADMDHALIRSVSTYEVHIHAAGKALSELQAVRCCCISQAASLGSSAMTCSLRVSRNEKNAEH